MSTPYPKVPFRANAVGGWPDDRKLRSWQGRAVTAIDETEASSFLLEACPAAGKTIPALRVTHERMSSGEIHRVIVVVPTVELAVQWARNASHVGLRVEPNWAGVGLPRDTQGIAITYQRLAAMPELYRAVCANVPTLVIGDEPHHMGETASWGQAFQLAFEHAAFTLLLSGTPFRSDNDPIPGVKYDEQGRATPDFSYSYPEAIRGRICRKIAFVHCDGRLRWSDRGTVVEASFGDHLDERQSRLRHRTAISAQLNDGLTRMIHDANERLDSVRQQGHHDAAGLIIACDIQHARDIAHIVEREVGEPAVIVHSGDPASVTRLRRFKDGDDRWIVAVNMVSEGVDIPRLRVGVYASTVKTPLFFRQVIGRFVRTIPGMACDPSYLFLPADPALARLASEIEDEMRHQLVAVGDPLPERPLSDPGEQPAGSFVPLHAQLRPWETVMSGLRFRDPDQAAALDTLSRQMQISVEELLSRLGLDDQPVLPPVDDETEFERRARLRQERKRLVGLLHVHTGREYREIQQQINEIVAAGRPTDAQTVDELERAIRYLTEELARVGVKRRREVA